jgi:peptidyl-tRNA hydrolase
LKIVIVIRADLPILPGKLAVEGVLLQLDDAVLTARDLGPTVARWDNRLTR